MMNSRLLTRRVYPTVALLYFAYVAVWSPLVHATDFQVIEAECRCTCPIRTQYLRDAIEKDNSSGVDENKTLTSLAKPQIETVATTTSRPQTTPNTADDGSGEDDVYSLKNYNIDEILTDEVEYPGPRRGDDVDVKVIRTKPTVGLMQTSDGMLATEPQVVKSGNGDMREVKGEKGAKGEQGPPGIAGTNGLDGAVGEPGDVGPPGPTGSSGTKGDKGDLGPRGFPGSMGLQGYRGAPGPMGGPGRQGPRGKDGPRGARGEPGAIGRRGMPGKSGIKGERGEPGPPGETTQSASPEQVAFLARLHNHFGPSTADAHIMFTQVDFNLGKGFDPSDGAFNVPIDGVYVFHLQVMAMADHIAWLAVKVNGEPAAYAWASGYTSATEQMGTAMTIQQLRRGDIVHVVQKASDNPPNYLYAHYTLFSGYRLG